MLLYGRLHIKKLDMTLPRKGLNLLLAVALAVTMCPLPSRAFADVSDKNKAEESAVDQSTESLEYKDLSYAFLPDGTIEICGFAGKIDDNSENVHLDIPSSIGGIQVTQIAEEAFAGNKAIASVFIPDSVNAIGNSAFYHCENLQAIAFSSAAPSFGFTVAEGSYNLKKVFALNSSDISSFCAILVNDLGEAEAKNVEVFEFDNLEMLKAAFDEFKTKYQAAPDAESDSVPELELSKPTELGSLDGIAALNESIDLNEGKAVDNELLSFDAPSSNSAVKK